MRSQDKDKIVFCRGGGCTAKLGAAALARVLEKLPRGPRDENLLVGYDSRDDAAVYKLTDELAMVQTLDFFPPMVEDPYIFGQIAAANALSDIYAMGGEVKTALNIVCFPEQMDLNILGEILRGGAEKVAEAGGQLAGGHSICDDSVKYGLSVTGTVHPDRILKNDAGQPGDVLILTKKLGAGLICTAARVGAAPAGSLEEAVASMTMLNKYAAEILGRYPVHACTDVTGFGLLGHLQEMLGGRLSAIVDADQVPVMGGAAECAAEFLLTAAAQRNRNFLAGKVDFENIPFETEEILFDPQTSGGLLAAAERSCAPQLLAELRAAGMPAAAVGVLTERGEKEIYVRKG